MAEYSERNAADRERLRRLASLSDEALTAEVRHGWTAGAVLAHVGFWDRVVTARWRAGLAAGALVEISREALADFVMAANEAGSGRGLMVDRSPHRRPHLDEIEAALGNGL